jgi:hypothetical protein
MIQEFEAAALFQKFGGMKGYDFLAPAGVDERVKALMLAMTLSTPKTSPQSSKCFRCAQP